MSDFENLLLLAFPTDHIIEDIDAFHRALANAEQINKAGHLVAFDIGPTPPETGDGCLQGGKPLDDQPDALQIIRFAEKPGQEIPEHHLHSREYFWDSGIYLSECPEKIHFKNAAHYKQSLRAASCVLNFQLAEQGRNGIV